MARLTALAGVLVACVLLLSSGSSADEQPAREPTSAVRPLTTGYILAKVGRAYCNGGATLSPASDSSTSAQSVSALSAAAIQAVTNVAAAAGLTFHKEVATPCWCLLAGAEKEEAMTAAIKALLQPSAEVMAASERVITHAAPENLYYHDETLPREPIAADRRAPATTQAAQATEPADTIDRRAQPSQNDIDGMPGECSTGTCNSLWGMNRIRAPDLWRRLVRPNQYLLDQDGFLQGTVIDDGVDILHNDIKFQVDAVKSRTFYGNNGNQPAGGVAATGQSHGSHCFGTMAGDWSFIGQSGYDVRGIAGVLGQTINKIVSCNVFGPGKGASDSDIAACLRHAVSVGAHYSVNLSLGGPGNRVTSSVFWRNTFDPFCAAGGVAVMSAGNGATVNNFFRGRDISDTLEDGLTHYFPAYAVTYFPDCILTVASISSNGDTMATDSNYGRDVNIAAPGVEVLSNLNSDGNENNRWASATWSGTSMAAPHVAGAVLLLRNLFKQATNRQIVQCITSSADRTVFQYWQAGVLGGGVLNVLAAYNCMLGGNAVNGGPPPATEILDCRSQQVTVPACINKTSGVENARCRPSATVFCLPVRDTSCSYRYSRLGTVCNATTRARCTGKTCECPVPPPTVQACTGRVPYLSKAVWRSCQFRTVVNRTCRADCDATLGYTGPGYTTTCRSDGTWTVPIGSCKSAVAPECAVNPAGRACQPGTATCNGCSCGQDRQTGDQGCLCNEQQGFTEFSFTYQNPTETISFCVWNLNYVKGYPVRANRGANVLIEVNVMAGFDKICPGKTVIKSVTFGALTRCPPVADIPATQYKTLRSAGTQPLNTARCTNVPGQGNTLAYAVQVNSPSGTSRGRCAKVTVTTTDDTTQVMLLRYLT